MDNASPGKKRKLWRGLAITSTVLLLGVVAWHYLQPKPKVIFSDGTEVVVESVEVFYIGEGETRWEQFCYWLGRVNKEGNVSRLAPTSSIKEWIDKHSRSVYFSGNHPSWYLKIVLSSNRHESFPEPIWNLTTRNSLESSNKLVSRFAYWMETHFFPGRIEAVFLSDEHDCVLNIGQRGGHITEHRRIDEEDPITYRCHGFDPSSDKLKLCFYQRGSTMGEGELREVWITNPRRKNYVFPEAGIKTLPQKVASDKDSNVKVELASLSGEPKLFIGDKEVSNEYNVYVERIDSPAEGVANWQNACRINMPLWRIKLSCSRREEVQKEHVGIPTVPISLPGTYARLERALLPTTMESAEKLMVFGSGAYCFDNQGEVIFAAPDFGDKTQESVAKFIRDSAIDNTAYPQAMGYNSDKGWKISGVFFYMPERGLIIISQHPFIRDMRCAPRDQNESIDLTLEEKGKDVVSWSNKHWCVKQAGQISTNWSGSYLPIPPNCDFLPSFDLVYTRRGYVRPTADTYDFTIGPIRPSAEDRHKAFHDSQQSMSSYLAGLSSYSEL